eukprot:4873715-Pyramimonas_sp.AAC.1
MAALKDPWAILKPSWALFGSSSFSSFSSSCPSSSSRPPLFYRSKGHRDGCGDFHDYRPRCQIAIACNTIKQRGDAEVKVYQDTYMLHVKSKRRKVGAAKHILSVRGGFILAVKRNLGHAGADAVLQHLEVPTSRYTVVRWELLCAAA